MCSEKSDMPSCASPLSPGGFNQFPVDCLSLCPVTPTHMAATPAPAAITLTPTPQTYRPAELRVCKSPAPSTPPPRSPRPPLFRRCKPALSLPNIQCMNLSSSTDDYKENMKSTVSTSGAFDKGNVKTPAANRLTNHISDSTTPGGLAQTQDNNEPVRLLPHLYLGSNFHASRQNLLEDCGITAVLNVSRLPNYFPTSFRYMQIPVDDNTDADLLPWFEEATDFIESVERSQGRVLVHCHAGISRSATICLAYLMKVRHLRLEEAFEFVRSVRCVISPNFSFMVQLLHFQDDLAHSRKENMDSNSPRNHLSFFSNANTMAALSKTTTSTRMSSAKTSSLAKASSKYLTSSALSTPHSKMSALSSPTLSENGSLRPLCLGKSSLLMKRMSRSSSFPLSNLSLSKSQGPEARKTGLVFDFNVPVLPKTAARSCSRECADLSPVPSPIYSPM